MTSVNPDEEVSNAPNQSGNPLSPIRLNGHGEQHLPLAENGSNLDLLHSTLLNSLSRWSQGFVVEASVGPSERGATSSLPSFFRHTTMPVPQSVCP